jgi:hypothetical protein
VDSRATYVSFGLAYLFGHGAAALSKGADPVLALPGWLPLTLLAAGLVAGTAYSISAATQAQRGASKPELLSAKLVAASWGTAFAGLFLVITGLAAVFDSPGLQDVLWPAGSTFLVGLIYLAEGAVRRITLHYGLGTWLALVAGASFFFPNPGHLRVLTIAGGGAYAVAAVMERRRIRTSVVACQQL